MRIGVVDIGVVDIGTNSTRRRPAIARAFRLAGYWARMSQENVEIVRGIYDAWARNEFPGPEHVLDAQIEYVNPAGAIEPGTRSGLAAFSRAVNQVFHQGGWESWRIEPERFTPVGDRVAVEVRYRARGRGSGVEVEGRMSALWTVRAGRVVRFEWFLEPTGALEAVGLSE